MEVNNNFNLIDACTFINFVHIDDNQGFLLSLMFTKMNIRLCEKVYSEIKHNIKKKIKKLTSATKQEKAEFHAKTNTALSLIATRQYANKQIASDYIDGEETIYEDYKCHFGNYTKDNGEYHSACLALFLSRYYDTNINFYTDDIPARKEFQPYFDYHQIGRIDDGIGLLINFYWLVDSFNIARLKTLLIDLKGEYNLTLSLSIDAIRNYRNKLLVKDSYKKTLNELLTKLNSSDFNQLPEALEKVKKEGQKKHKAFIQELEGLNTFEELKSFNIPEITKKIDKTLEKIDKTPPYKV